MPVLDELYLNFKYRKFIKRQKNFYNDNLGCCLVILAKLKNEVFNLPSPAKFPANDVDVENPNKRLNELGIEYETLEISMESINEKHLPSLILWNSDQFVVLIEKNYHGFIIIDPLRYPMKYYNDQFECQFCESLILIKSFPSNIAP